jgi:hypothetical protein
MLGQVMQWHWSRAGWGRWLLALFALFELCRRMQLGDAYTLLMGALIGLILIGASLRLNGMSARLASACSGLLLAASVCTPLLPSLSLPDWAAQLALAAALPLFAFALLSQVKSPSPQ